MAVSEENRARFRAIQVARQAKDIFMGPPERFAKAMLGRFFLGPLLRWLFLAPDGRLHRAGEIVIAELRRENGMDRPTQFHSDALVLAYRTGRRDSFHALINYLNLDESTVRYIMELDDGLGE